MLFFFKFLLNVYLFRAGIALTKYMEYWIQYLFLEIVLTALLRVLQPSGTELKNVANITVAGISLEYLSSNKTIFFCDQNNTCFAIFVLMCHIRSVVQVILRLRRTF